MLQVEPLLPLWIIVSVGTTLLLLVGWLEWKRNAKYVAARLVAVILMMLSIVLYLLQPGFQNERNSQGVIVLTQNYLSTKADSVRTMNPNLRLLVMPDAAPYAGAHRLSTRNEILDFQQEIRIVLGDGLPGWALPESGFQFIPGVKQKGIITLNVPERIYANRKVKIEGVWRGDATSLTLFGPGGRVDSVRLLAGESKFALSFTPRQSGKFLYKLRSSPTAEETLPIDVLPARALEILLMQSYPSAETRYLKNFLIDQGHRVAVRTQVSKTSFRSEFGNRTSLNLSRITPELLKEFDLVVLANEMALSKTEQGVLESSIRSGLGLLWLCTNEEVQKPYFGLESVLHPDDTARVRLEGKQFVFPAVSTQIKSKVVPVLANADRTLSGYKVSGTGKIGFQLLQETYTLIVKEESEVYGFLWTSLLETLVRPIAEPAKINIRNVFPIYPNEPVEIDVIASQPLPEVRLDSVVLPLREDVVIDGFWETIGWTTQSGWHSVTAEDSTTTSFYVSKGGAWQALRSSALQSLNQARQSTAMANAETTVTEFSRVSQRWFFILFLVSAGFLWLAPKL